MDNNETTLIGATATLKKLTFTISSDGTYYSVKALNTSIIDEVVIPSTYEGLPVKEIGFNAFANCSALTSITIGNNVTSIGNYAFFYCPSLTSVTIPDSVTVIGELAFSNCSSLTSVTIPNSVTSIGDRVFLFCSSLTSVNIPDNVTTIGSGAFSGCSSLTSINIPNSVTSIGYSTFNNCSSLTNIIIKGKPTVHSDAFISTPKLEKIYVIDGQGYASTDKIAGKPIKILPSTPAVVVKEMNVETMNIV